jgi:hypothetical protein
MFEPGASPAAPFPPFVSSPTSFLVWPLLIIIIIIIILLLLPPFLTSIAKHLCAPCCLGCRQLLSLLFSCPADIEWPFLAFPLVPHCS